MYIVSQEYLLLSSSIQIENTSWHFGDVFLEFIATLDQDMIKKLAIRSLRRGVGSMDYIHSLLIMEDDLDKTNEPQTEDSSQMGQLSTTNSANCGLSQVEETEASVHAADPSGSQPALALPWCVCRQCRPMLQTNYVH